MTRLRSAFSGWMAAACGQLRGDQRMHRECRETLCSLLVDGRHMEERRREESARALGRFGGPSGRPHAAGSPRQGPKTHCTTGGVPMGPIGRCNAFGLSGGQPQPRQRWSAWGLREGRNSHAAFRLVSRLAPNKGSISQPTKLTRAGSHRDANSGRPAIPNQSHDKKPSSGHEVLRLLSAERLRRRGPNLTT